MALGFIRKLAAKLLGKKRTVAAEAKQTRTSSQQHQNRTLQRGTSGKTQQRADKRSQDSRRFSRPDRKERSTSMPRQASRLSKQSPSSVPQNAASQTVRTPATNGRPTARPVSVRGERRPRRYENASSTRPGGVMNDADRAKRREEHAKWDPASFTVAPAEGKKRFHDLDLPGELMHAIADLGFRYCSPIQSLSLDAALAGKNVAGRAQTGTGKTAAYLVAILTRYLRTPESRPKKGGIPRALVLAPTRELVVQIAKDADALGKYCGLRCLAVYGGMDYERQKAEVSDEPVDLLVATPGRLLDFIRSHVIDLGHVDTLVIDEADRMLDMGFIPDVRSIIRRLPAKEKRTTMLYSATLNENIMSLASQWMAEPVRCEVEGETVNTKAIKQIVYVVTANQKFTILFNHIMQYPDSRILIFCNRRHTTEDVAESLRVRGIRCEMLSGDVNQNQRLRVLDDFRAGKIRIVVATDVAGRGLHVEDIGFVINFDFPYEPEDYVHRIGRTGRAGATGTAISFADEDESFIIPDIEKYIGEDLKCTMIQPEDPLLTQLPDRHGRRVTPRREADSAAPAEKAVVPPTVNEAAPDSAPVAAPAPVVAQEIKPEVSATVAPDTAPVAEKTPEVASVASTTESKTTTDRAESAATVKPVAEKPAHRAPFIRPRNAPIPARPVAKPSSEQASAPFVKAKSTAQEQQDPAKKTQAQAEEEPQRKAPLPPLCKPVFDKPWMVHDAPSYRRGTPRQRQTVRAKVLEEWTPGQNPNNEK